MYTIIDERLDQQLLQPITRKQPKETCAQTRTAPGQSSPEPHEPWKIPFIDDQEWQLFLNTIARRAAQRTGGSAQHFQRDTPRRHRKD